MKRNSEPFNASPLHIAGAWVFLGAAAISGVVGVYRMMSPAVTDAVAGAGAVNASVVAQRGGDCLCLAVLLALMGAVLALLGIHRQMMFSTGPSYQGSTGSGDDK